MGRFTLRNTLALAEFVESMMNTGYESYGRALFVAAAYFCDDVEIIKRALKKMNIDDDLVRGKILHCCFAFPHTHSWFVSECQPMMPLEDSRQLCVYIVRQLEHHQTIR